MNLTHVQKVRILYKTVLRLHRGLPEALQPLGNGYARDEFKRHKKCTEPEAQVFMNEWANYAMNLANQLGIKGPPKPIEELGTNLEVNALNNLRDEQVAQLYELLLAAKGEDDQIKSKNVDENKSKS